MSFSFYESSVPVVVRALENLKHVLAKGEAHAKERGQDAAGMLGARLAEDMLPLYRQVQIAGDMAKGAGARLTGTQAPSFPDEEADFAGLRKRLDETISFLRGVKPEAMDDAAGKVIHLKFPNLELHLDAQTYVTGFVLPNVFFHATTAYAILRHLGVPLGKADFMGHLPQAEPVKAETTTPS